MPNPRLASTQSLQPLDHHVRHRDCVWVLIRTFIVDARLLEPVPDFRARADVHAQDAGGPVLGSIDEEEAVRRIETDAEEKFDLLQPGLGDPLAGLIDQAGSPTRKMCEATSTGSSSPSSLPCICTST